MLSVWCPYCGRKANTHPSSIGTLKRCPQCNRQYEVIAPAARPRSKSNPFVVLIGCLALAGVGVVGLACCGGLSAVLRQPHDDPHAADKSPVVAKAPAAPNAPDPVEPSAPPPFHLPSAKDEADATEAVLVARDLLVKHQSHLAVTQLQDAVKKYPGTKASAEALDWLDGLTRHERARVASADRCLDAAAGKPFLAGLAQVPATVIDKGVLRNVPYRSYHAGDYELNVYGDPEEPACVEIGVYRGAVKSNAAKQNCVDFIASVLSDPRDCALLPTLKLAKDLVRRDGLTVEVTPETAEDSYGGWWVSLYKEKALDQARASEAEMQQIAVRRKEVETNAGNAADWGAIDLKSARPAPNTGSVYVRGYTRKDGTYVRPHTRSR